MNDGDSVKVSVLLNGTHINQYAANASQRMVNETSAEITLLVINSGTNSVRNKSSAGVTMWAKKAIDLWKKHGIWSVMIAKKNFFPPKYARKIHIDNMDCFSEARGIQTEPISAEGLGNKLPDSTVNEISSSSDVIIRFGFGIIKGDVLSCTEYGVLSFHHGDIRKYRGRAGGYWAYVNDDRYAGITLQQLNESLDGGKIAVYESVNIDNFNTLKKVRKEVHEVSEGMLATGINKIENGNFNPESPDELGEIYTEKNITDISKFILKDSIGKLKNLIGT